MIARQSRTIIYFLTLVSLLIAIAPVTALVIVAGEPPPELHTIAEGDPVTVSTTDGRSISMPPASNPMSILSGGLQHTRM